MSVRNLSTGVALVATIHSVPYQDGVRNFSDVALLWRDFCILDAGYFCWGKRNDRVMILLGKGQQAW